MIGDYKTLIRILLTVYTVKEWSRTVTDARQRIISNNVHDLAKSTHQILKQFDRKHMEQVPLISRDGSREFLTHLSDTETIFPKPLFSNVSNDASSIMLTNSTAPFALSNQQIVYPAMKLSNSDEPNEKKERSVQIVQNLWWLPWAPKFDDCDRTAVIPDKHYSKEPSQKLEPLQKKISIEEPTQPLHISDKLKRLLNLFSIVKFDNVQCDANGGTGICLHQLECERLNGKFNTTCAQNLGVCCFVENAVSNEKTCGEYSRDSSTLFVNRGFSESSNTGPNVCTLTLEKTEPSVIQLRLDFIEFQLREPTNGTCFHDRLVITGQNVDNVIPEICGYNTGQHIYVDVDASVGPFKINIVIVGEYYPRNFKIKITQLKQGDEKLAPKHCLQIYTEPTGTVESFNYRKNTNAKADETITGYFNNLNYAICIRKMAGFCSVSYENIEVDDLMKPTFQIINMDEVGEELLQPRQAGAETFNCPNDYIVIGGMRLCGEKLNDGSIDGDLTKNYPITDTSNGPIIISVRTDGSVTGRGFSLMYKQNPCLV